MLYRTKVRRIDVMRFDKDHTEEMLIFLAENDAVNVRIERGYLSFLWNDNPVTVPLGLYFGFGDDKSVLVLSEDHLQTVYEPIKEPS